MESYVPFIYHLKEIALNYKRTGYIPARYKKSHSVNTLMTEQSICDEVLKENDILVEPGPGPFLCCGYTFRYPSQYRIHLKTSIHTSNSVNSMLICTLCGECFENKRDQLEHKRSKHSYFDQPVCSTCGISFESEDGLRTHVKSEHFKSRLFKCDQCSYQSFYKGDLQKHTKTHSKEHKPKMEPVECCGRVFKYPSTLAAHKKICSSSERSPKIICGICKEQFDNIEAVRFHRSTFHQVPDGHLRTEIRTQKPKMEPVECCGRIFKFQSTLKEHKNWCSATKVLKVQCGICKEKFVSKEALALHKSSIHHFSEGKWFCTICNKAFSSNNKLTQHRNTAHHQPPREKRPKMEPVECCGSVFRYPSQLAAHKKSCSSTEELKILCGICEERFHSSEAVRIHRIANHQVPDGHLRTVSEEQKAKMEPVECCGRVYKCRSTLKEHKYSCSATKVLKVKCGICKERFVSKEALELHRSSIHQFSEGKWTCLICDKAFATNGILSIHINTVHIKSTVYSCSKCQLSFTRKDTFQSHYKFRHLKPEKKFECDMCGRKFHSKSNLAEHIRIHLKEHFDCSVCSRSFLRPELLKVHQMVHRPCQICGLTFIRKKEREAHLRWHLQKIRCSQKIIPNDDKEQEQATRTTLKELHQNS